MLRSRATGTPWHELDRPRLHVPFEEMAAVTVIATLPSWGATTWIDQQRRLLSRHGQARTRLVGSRTGARRALTSEALADVDVLLIDDVPLTVGDDLWNAISRAARVSDARIVVWSLDCPPPMEGVDLRVLTEADLALEASEVSELALLNDVQCPPGMISTLSTRYRGNPTLTRVRLQRLATAGQLRAFSNPDDRLDVHLANETFALGAGTLTTAWQKSAMATVLDKASSLRRVSLGTLSALIDDEIDVHAHHRRLLSLPFGIVESDETWGGYAFQWSDPVWSHFDDVRGKEHRDAAKRRAVDACRTTGEHTLELFTLVDLGELDAAEALAHDRLQYFLLTVDDPLAHAALTVEWDSLSRCPSLLLLIGGHHSRAFGSHNDAKVYYTAALEAMEAAHPSTPFERLRLATRRAYAHSSLGQRDRALRSLEACQELLDGDSDNAVLRASKRVPYVAEHIAAELHLQFWVATQLDLHSHALRLARLMDSHADPRSRTAVAERQAILTQYVLAGLDNTGADLLTRANTEPLLLLEQGLDDQALDALRLLEERVDASPSRSGAEAMLVIVHAFARGGVDLYSSGNLERTLSRSRTHWQDGEASTAVTGAAALAMTARGRHRAALQLARAHPRRDWFIVCAEAVALLALDRASDAVPVIEDLVGLSDLPRARATASTLGACAQLRLGRAESALSRLESTMTATSAGMVRLALRLVPHQDVEALLASASAAAPAVKDMLVQSLEDPHPVTRGGAVTLSPVEREILALLREGATNTEIARRRFVSTNTVRTQVRLLLRKLDAADRHEAVERADALGDCD